MRRREEEVDIPSIWEHIFDVASILIYGGDLALNLYMIAVWYSRGATALLVTSVSFLVLAHAALSYNLASLVYQVESREFRLCLVCAFPVAWLVPWVLALHELGLRILDSIGFEGYSTIRINLGESHIRWIHRKVEAHSGYLVAALTMTFPFSIMKVVSIATFPQATPVELAAIFVGGLTILCRAPFFCRSSSLTGTIFNHCCVAVDVFMGFSILASIYLNGYNVVTDIWLAKAGIIGLLWVLVALRTMGTLETLPAVLACWYMAAVSLFVTLSVIPAFTMFVRIPNDGRWRLIAFYEKEGKRSTHKHERATRVEFANRIINSTHNEGFCNQLNLLYTNYIFQVERTMRLYLSLFYPLPVVATLVAPVLVILNLHNIITFGLSVNEWFRPFYMGTIVINLPMMLAFPALAAYALFILSALPMGWHFIKLMKYGLVNSFITTDRLNEMVIPTWKHEQDRIKLAVAMSVAILVANERSNQSNPLRSHALQLLEPIAELASIPLSSIKQRQKKWLQQSLSLNEFTQNQLFHSLVQSVPDETPPTSSSAVTSKDMSEEGHPSQPLNAKA